MMQIVLYVVVRVVVRVIPSLWHTSVAVLLVRDGSFGMDRVINDCFLSTAAVMDGV
jgi:hypothetical protein